MVQSSHSSKPSSSPGPRALEENHIVPKRLSYFHDALALCTVDFPIFFIESISERHIVIAGGGGSSKTGVHNQINVIELRPSNGSCYAELVTKYRTPEEIPDAIMTAALMRDTTISETRLLSGGTNATIYTMNFDPASRRYNVVDYETLQDSKPRAEVKCVKYVPGRILTGGIDGRLTCWSEDHVAKEIKAHTKEIDEIDVDTTNEHLLTLSRGEGRFVIWNLNNSSKISEHSNKDMNKTPGVNYSARSCRYAYDKTSDNSKGSNKSVLLVACNPVPAKNQPCMLYKWMTDSTGYKLVDAGRPLAVDGVMAMSVSLDGQYVGFGTRSGGVCVLETRNLKQVYSIEGAHYNAVTGLEFLPPKQESRTLTNCKLCPLLSVSLDRRLVLHRPTSHSSTLKLIKTILMLTVIFILLFTLSSHYNLRLTQ